MHRKSEAELLPLDTELERTLRNLKKVRFAEQEPMADQREEQPEVPAVGTSEIPQVHYTMEDFWKTEIKDEYSAVVQPAIEANNFELKPSLINMVQQNQFTGHPSEDPNEHMGRFMRMANTIKLNGVRP